MMSFEQIEAARRRHGLTRIAVYSRAEVSGETYRRSERGTTKPGSETLERLEKALRELVETETADAA